MYDAIIVGARCGGAPLAMLLAREGKKVLLLDRMAFGSDIMSTHYLKRPGAALLQKWGLLDAVKASGAPAIERLTFNFGGLVLNGTAPPSGDVKTDFTPRRFVLDKILVDAAVAAGVEARDHFSVSSVIMENGRAVGIRGKGRNDATEIEARASIVIGADGVRSMVAQAVGAEKVVDAGSHCCGHYAYYSGMRQADNAVSVHIRHDLRRFYITFPTNDGLDMVFLFWHKDQADSLKTNLEAAWDESLSHIPELQTRVKAGKRESRIVGTNLLPNFFRRAHGPGWALVGDAALHRDPITAQGITNAFTQADILAEELIRAFRGEQSLDEASAKYDHRQYEKLKPMFDFTVHMAMLEVPSAELQAMLPVVATNPEATSAFFGAFLGSLALADVFPPQLIDLFAADVARSEGDARRAAEAVAA